MRKTSQVFHLAIPCANLQEAKSFYSQLQGCRVAREYDDRVTIDFFGDQLVCHLAPDGVSKTLELYPRHFGITFLQETDWQMVLNQAKQLNLHFFKEPFRRFAGKNEEHHTFVIVDPSNNLIEFKYYLDPKMAY